MLGKFTSQAADSAEAPAGRARPPARDTAVSQRAVPAHSDPPGRRADAPHASSRPSLDPGGFGSFLSLKFYCESGVCLHPVQIKRFSASPTSHSRVGHAVPAAENAHPLLPECPLYVPQIFVDNVRSQERPQSIPRPWAPHLPSRHRP